MANEQNNNEMNWGFKREKAIDIPDGKHKLQIKAAEKAVSKKGNPMLILTFRVWAQPGQLFYYIPFLKDKPEVTNRLLTSLFDSFSKIGEGNFDLATWVGAVGWGVIGHEDYNGEMQPKVKYFITKEDLDWLEDIEEEEKEEKESDTEKKEEKEEKGSEEVPVTPPSGNPLADVQSMFGNVTEMPF